MQWTLNIRLDMRNILLIAVAFLTAAIGIKAQKVQVVDDEGLGIPLATVLTEEGVMIGSTNLEGYFDMNGAQKVVVTHVAYKPLTISAATIQNGRVVMENQDYSIGEITITPKQYIYVETYYRVYVYRNDSLCYFLTGIMPNAYDPQKKKREHGSYFYGNVEYAPKMGVAMNWSARAQILHAGLVQIQGATDKFMKEQYYTTGTAKSSNHKVYANPRGVVGNLVASGGSSRLTLDAGKMQMYVNETKGQTKVLEKRQKMDYQYQYTLIYDGNDENDYDVANFVMRTDHWEYNDKKSHVKFIIETYAVDHAYINKVEWKDKKNELKQKYKNAQKLSKLEEYEKQHNIPALAPTVRQAILKLKQQ